uniref:Uncharacterized protein n=1 Tax=Oryza nivara TaxID=4536 RepID=A0A0E0HQV6_ORYNI
MVPCEGPSLMLGRRTHHRLHCATIVETQFGLRINVSRLSLGYQFSSGILSISTLISKELSYQTHSESTDVRRDGFGRFTHWIASQMYPLVFILDFGRSSIANFCLLTIKLFAAIAPHYTGIYKKLSGEEHFGDDSVGT